ncbi:Dual oxidase 2 [Rhizoctonia solani]|uniref:Dual oxidase 2 n=1 Tax=Rhizoctonia solani TaxID=456999 RepID=A0A0K6GH93_9AGAM|nr:Dual oxidase 2 [Rhizoctonia solani]
MFRAFQHRKERKGLQHEFIVLMLLDGSLCRFERMGDPDARFDALSPHGTIAHDMAQCFRPGEIDQACLKSSDLVAEVMLPCDFDIMDVLKICRAIHEGEKTRNYTLQIYNCWFFSLAIQVCLTRLVAHWEDQERIGFWLSQVNKAIGSLTSTGQSLRDSTPTLHRQIFSQVFSILRPRNDNYEETFVKDVKLQLQSRIATGSTIVEQITYRVNNLLWYSTINSNLNEFIKEEVHGAIMSILRDSLEEFIRRVGGLLKNQAAIWDKSPWNNIHEFIARSVPKDILEGVELHNPKLGFRTNEQFPEQSKLDISAFQRHIMDRIKIHAEEVEKKWLGSAASIQFELEGVLSRVWETIREETSETQKTKPISRRYIPSPYKRKVLLIGSGYSDPEFETTSSDLDYAGLHSLPGVEEDFGSLTSVFKQRSFMVETLFGDWFDGKTILQWVKMFLNDANEGDVRVIIFSGHAALTQVDQKLALIPPSGYIGITDLPDERLISADTWRETVKNSVQPGVVVVSIFSACMAGALMSQPINMKDYDSLIPIEAAQTSSVPIFLTLASSRDNESSYESVVGPPHRQDSQDDSFRYGDHFLRALTLALESALDWKGFIEDLEEKFSQLRMIGAICAAHDPDDRDPNWLETHPQNPVFTTSHPKLPDFGDIFPLATPPGPRDLVKDLPTNLTKEFLAHISLCDKVTEITLPDASFPDPPVDSGV